MLNKQHAASVQWALAAINRDGQYLNKIKLYDQYYSGDHPLSHSMTRFLETFGNTFRANIENLCKLPIDILGDLLQPESFLSRDGDEAANEAAAEIWRRERMLERAGWVHTQALLYGESFVMVDQDEQGRATICPNKPSFIAVEYHPTKIGYIVRAAKMWDEYGYRHLDVYTTKTITRYRTKSKTNGISAPANFELYEDGEVQAETINPWGKVPVFRFANNAGLGDLGISELKDILPIQDRINKFLSDYLITSEYTAYPQRYALGLPPLYDEDGNKINPFIRGAENMWAIEDKEVTIGQLPAGDLNQYIAMLNDARMCIARISGIPSHYLHLDSGGFPSGESLKTASERLTRKALDRQVSFGNSWADVMRFAVQVETETDIEFETQWNDPTPRVPEDEIWDVAIKQQSAGVSAKQTLIERGYTEVQADEFVAELNGDGFPAPEVKP